jgi:predicted PurR-regulated permease PerM
MTASQIRIANPNAPGGEPVNVQVREAVILPPEATVSGTPALVAVADHQWPISRTVLATLIMMALGVGALLLVTNREVCLLLFAGIVLATALNPLIDLLVARLHLARSYAAIIVYALFALLLLATIVLLVPEIISQGQAFWQKLPGLYDQGREYLVNSSNRTLRSLGSRVPEEMPKLASLSQLATGFSNREGSTISIFLIGGQAILGVLAVGVLAFYWSVGQEQTVEAVLSLAPLHRRTYFQGLVDEMLKKLGGYIRGQLILCAAVGVLSLIAYLLIGLPYALMLALIACVLEAVPIIGPTLGAVPAILVALSLGPEQTALVIGAAMLIQTLENYLLVPKIMDRSVGIGAVVTLLAIVACGALFGLVGAILAIPLAAITQTLFERLVLQADFKEKKFSASRSASGVLHYQLQDLIQDVKRQQRQKTTRVDPWTTESFAEIETLAVALDEIVTEEDPDEPAPALVITAETP